MKNVNERIQQLREVMRREKIDAFIFPSTDPHCGEYVPSHWEGRKWISGFDGSAGTAVVTLNEAAVWTDSRYFIAAAEQLRDTEFVLMKEMLEDTPTIPQWLGRKLSMSGGTCVGIDGMVMMVDEVEALKAELQMQGGITVRVNFDPLNEIWRDRPEVPLNAVEVQPLQYAGESVASKLSRIREKMHQQHACGMLVTTLDDIAWTLNMRGADVHCTPLFVSYLLITDTTATLFIDPRKLTPAVEKHLRDNNVALSPYTDVAKALRQYREYNILMNSATTNYTLFNTVTVKVVNAPLPIPVMKAIKNEAEIEGYRSAMLRDGVALVKFLRWLKPAVEAGSETELSVDRKLTSLRAQQPLYRDISFDTISAYEQHGAIVHYEPTPESDIPLQPHGLLLLDSGAQYQDGTTDITRTIALGPLTDEQRRVYTLVLKGNIQLAMLKFPDGASGTQLDALARMDMWREGMNYLHGTGHGVGSYLSVHEGPHQIRMQWKPTPLRAGMTVTDEPGIYLEGRFGVRTENTMLITPYLETEFGRFLQLEPLTLCPIDTTPILWDMMRPEEVQWLNAYHQRVREALLPLLDDEQDKQWLIEKTEQGPTPLVPSLKKGGGDR